MADGHHVENHKVAISLKPNDALCKNLVYSRTLARRTLQGVKISNFKTYKMFDR